MYRTLFGVILFVLLGSMARPDDLTVLPDQLEDAPSGEMVSRYLKALADEAFARRRDAYEQLKTAEGCHAYQEHVRELFIEQLGPLPERTPLNARVTGELSGDGYRVEKLIYESQPRHYVTAALDEGPIIEQDVSRVGHGQSVKDFAAIGRDVECVVLARAVEWFVQHRILLNGDRTVVFR